MKKLLGSLVAAMLLVAVAPVFAVTVGEGITPDIITEDFAPLVWMCDHRLMFDDNVEPGRFGDQDGGDLLFERMTNYAFEGEQIMWIVLVKDKNGIEKLEDVFVTLGDVQGAGNDIEVDCDYKPGGISSSLFETCNARIGEEELDWGDYQDEIGQTMSAYKCVFTVETSESMYGEYWVTIEATDLDGLSGTMDENEYWFFNPVVALSIEGDLIFDDVRPGTSAYSETLLIGNDADPGSGVRLDMFVSGTDFYDGSSSGAMCPGSNVLKLGDGDSDCDDDDEFCYFATHGAYSTGDSIMSDGRADSEGYVGIIYGDTFDPSRFYGNAEIMQSGPMNYGYYQANILSPGAEMALTFRLNLPEPCNGDFDSGSIYFWGEAI